MTWTISNGYCSGNEVAIGERRKTAVNRSLNRGMDPGRAVLIDVIVIGEI
jgi:hypothetical protein